MINTVSVRIISDSWKITALWKIILPNSLCSKALLISLLSKLTGGAQSFLIKLCNDHFADEISVAFLNQQKQHFSTLRGDVHGVPVRFSPNPAPITGPHHPAWPAEQLAHSPLAHFSHPLHWGTSAWGMVSQSRLSQTKSSTQLAGSPSLWSSHELLLLISSPNVSHNSSRKPPVTILPARFLSSSTKLWGGSQMALQVKELAEGRECITQTGEEREAGRSPFSSSDALLAQLMISFGWHTFRHNHTLAVRYEGLEPRHWEQQTPEPAQQQLEEDTQSGPCFGCGAVVMQPNHPHSLLPLKWEIPPSFSPLPHTPPCWQKHSCDSSEDQIGNQSLTGFHSQQTQMTAGTLLPAQGTKGQQWSTLTCTKTPSETFFYRANFLQIFFFQLINHKLYEC